MNSAYVPLWVKSNFSFLEGGSHPAELVEACHRLGLPAMALTDRDGVYGVVQAAMAAKTCGLELIVGSEVSITPSIKSQGCAKTVILLAVDRHGYGQLCQLLSQGRLRSSKGCSQVSIEEVCAAAAGLLALCPSPDFLLPLREAYGDRLYALCARHRHSEEQAPEHALRTLAKRLGIPWVAGNEVLYHAQHRKPLQDVLTCIRHGVTLAQAGRCIRANAENDLKATVAMEALFADAPQAVWRTQEVAERCGFRLSQLSYRYPTENRPDGKNEKQWLYELTLAGADQRYPGGQIDPKVLGQIERELQVIDDLDYGGYFLTMWEIVQFCRRENILCQGRGSAANSAVCYCLGITAVDPIKLDLLFERFLSQERAEPPDIDLDIEHNRREEVIQWVYQRYGRRHAAMVANVIRYRMRSGIRDVGKVLGLPSTALDRLCKLLGGRFEDLGAAAVEFSGLDISSTVLPHFLHLVGEIQEFPRHLSVHPGGFLVGHDPVDTLVPIEPASMADRTVIQWDKYAIEDLRLFKVDLLGLGALTQIHQCFDLLRKHQGLDLQLATIPAEDPQTYAMISRGDTVGVFQIESRAQMSMLPRLKPKTFYDLVIEVAIVRPGPIQGDMVHPYLKRRSGEERETYPHEALRAVLEKTRGVPIFQEQVMKIAVLVGGYSPGEADQLRRDMAAWKSSGKIERHHQRLVNGMLKQGITLEFAERIFSQIRGFGEYGFPESHAASFALIAYATAWLRCHHPAAFTCSLLNAQPMGFYSPATLVEDAKRRGIDVRAVDVNHSQWDCTLEPLGADQFAVRMGLRYVKGLGEQHKQALQCEPGPYANLDDFVRRVKLPEHTLKRLAESGAFVCFGVTRREALWSVAALAKSQRDSLPLAPRVTDSQRQENLFAPLTLPQEIHWDYRSSAHSSRGHPLLQIRRELEARNIPTAKVVNAMPDGSVVKYVGMTICRQRPATATGVTFYTLEDETGFVNLVVWSQVFERYAVIARTASLLGVDGRLQSENGIVHLIAETLWVPQMLFNEAGTTTRSFH
ncbi:MAG: error-prone DNA polymerase [Myxococcota bacterium]